MNKAKRKAAAKRPGGRFRRRLKLYSEPVWIYGAFCWYCGARVTEVNHHVDYIIPKSRGGMDDINNLALACSFCNYAKQAKSLADFLGWIEHVRGEGFRSQIRDRLGRLRISRGQGEDVQAEIAWEHSRV